MKQVIIIHGSPDQEEYYENEWPSPSNAFWTPWLQKQLSRKDILAQALEFPKPYNPTYEEWLAVFKQLEINNESILVGHSSGGAFLLRFFSEYPQLQPAKIVLVAPWVDPLHELTTGFCDFEIDSDLPNRTQLHIFMSSDDSKSQMESFKIVKEKLPNALYHEFTDRGHFDGFSPNAKEFPELLEVVLK